MSVCALMPAHVRMLVGVRAGATFNQLWKLRSGKNVWFLQRLDCVLYIVVVVAL